MGEEDHRGKVIIRRLHTLSVSYVLIDLDHLAEAVFLSIMKLLWVLCSGRSLCSSVLEMRSYVPSPATRFFFLNYFCQLSLLSVHCGIN